MRPLAADAARLLGAEHEVVGARNGHAFLRERGQPRGDAADQLARLLRVENQEPLLREFDAERHGLGRHECDERLPAERGLGRELEARVRGRKAQPAAGRDAGGLRVARGMEERSHAVSVEVERREVTLQRRLEVEGHDLPDPEHDQARGGLPPD